MNIFQISQSSGRVGISCIEHSHAIGTQHDLYARFQESSDQKEKSIDLQHTQRNFNQNSDSISNLSIQSSLKLLNTVKDLTKALGLSRSTIYNKIKEGRFPVGIKIGTSRRWPASDTYAWLEQQRSMGE